MTIMGMVTDHPMAVWFLDAELASRDRWMITIGMVDDCSGDGG